MTNMLTKDGLLYVLQKIKELYVAKEPGKGLSTNDFTAAEKAKLQGIADKANNYSLPEASANTLGGVKVGAGLSITKGVLSADGGGTADAVEWDNVQNKPSTFPPATHNHDTEYYKKGEVDAKLGGKAEKSTTLSGYGIADAYTKTEIDGKISSVFKPAGSVAFAGLPSTPAVAQSGFVYNLTEAFTTDARFVEGAGKKYPIGTNVVVVTTAESGVYKFDTMAGFVDLSGYVETKDLVAITNEEIDQLFAS